MSVEVPDEVRFRGFDGPLPSHSIDSAMLAG